MEFQYKGANCVQITTKAATLMTDPNLTLQGAKSPSLAKVDVCLLTDPRFKPETTENAFMVDCPGEYEVSGFAIKGIAARAHMDEEKIHTATLYRITASDLNVVVCGHIYPALSDEQLEAIGLVDVMIVPVGGNGYTLDAIGAAKLVRAVSPKAVVPVHYADEGLNYEVPQNHVEDFIKELGAPVEQVDKLKLKKDTLADALTVFQIKRS